jgi:hypothetical protein
MTKLLAKLICHFYGHKRGRLVAHVGDLKTFACGRGCGNTTQYKEKKRQPIRAVS